MALTTKPVEMKIYSNDFNKLNDAADLVTQAMREIAGTKCIVNSNDLMTYSFSVNMDTKSLNSIGLTKAEVSKSN